MRTYNRKPLPPHLAKLNPEQLRDFAMKNAANRERAEEITGKKNKGFSFLLKMLGGKK